MNSTGFRRRRPLVLSIALVFAGFLLIVDVFVGPHLSFNHTDSMPRGFYWRTAVPTDGPHREDIVIACAPPEYSRFGHDRGFLDVGPCDGVTTLLKRVVAATGDRVHLDEHGVAVDGQPVHNSMPQSVISHGDIMPHVRYGDYILTTHEVWLASEAPKGFDSRYFGPVTRVIAIAHPILVF